MSIRDIIMATVAQAQAQRPVEIGRYVRGAQLVDVLAVSEERIGWREVNGGAEYDRPRAEFLARAVTAVAPPQKPDADEADVVWAVASTKALAPEERVAIIAATWPTAAKAAPVDAWLAALRLGREPVREAT